MEIQREPAITVDGMVWYSESGVKPDTTIQFDPKTEKFARANIPSGGGTVRNMAATADGRVYIACSKVDKVGGSWNPLTDISLPGESSFVIWRTR